MGQQILKIFKLADELNKKQDNFYAVINYFANDNRRLEIYIRRKDNFDYIQRCELFLKQGSTIGIESAVQMLEMYVNREEDNE